MQRPRTREQIEQSLAEAAYFWKNVSKDFLEQVSKLQAAPNPLMKMRREIIESYKGSEEYRLCLMSYHSLQHVTLFEENLDEDGEPLPSRPPLACGARYITDTHLNLPICETCMAVVNMEFLAQFNHTMLGDTIPRAELMAVSNIYYRLCMEEKEPELYNNQMGRRQSTGWKDSRPSSPVLWWAPPGSIDIGVFQTLAAEGVENITTPYSADNLCGNSPHTVCVDEA